MTGFFIALMERGLLPDFLVRFGIRRLCADRLAALAKAEGGQRDALLREHVAKLRAGAVAFATDKANQQHYEVPAGFFELVLGPNLKYSCAEWQGAFDPAGLRATEELALATTMKRAELADGMKILELGCGWGSLTLAMAARFPRARITAVSNSSSQREFIEARARQRGLTNVEVLTRDLGVTLDLGEGRGGYDRIVSVEMFEHVYNYDEFFRRIERWVAPGGKMFVHIFTHRHYPYPFETEGDDNWMGRYFFTGGQMPSRHLLPEFQEAWRLENQWEWSGTHYQKTSDAWLANMDREAEKIRPIFAQVYGPSAEHWFHRWRVFFMACAELFGYDGGREWGVTHYLFSSRRTS